MRGWSAERPAAPTGESAVVGGCYNANPMSLRAAPDDLVVALGPAA